MSTTQLKEWHYCFKTGRTSVESETDSGRLSTWDRHYQLRILMMQDCQIMIRKLAYKVGITNEPAHSIMKEDLGFRRISLKVIPKLQMKQIAHDMLEIASNRRSFSLENRQALHKMSCRKIIQIYVISWKTKIRQCPLTHFHSPVVCRWLKATVGKKLTHAH